MGCACLRCFPNAFGVTVACFVVIFMLYSVQHLRTGKTTSHFKRVNNPTHRVNIANHVKSEKGLATDTKKQKPSMLKKTREGEKIEHRETITANALTGIKGKNEMRNGNTIDKEQEIIQSERLQHFQKKCKIYKFDAHSFNSTDGIRVFYSEKYKLAYRLVPKIGSTFMIQVYSVLENDTNALEVFDLARSDVHSEKAKSYRGKIAFSNLEDYTLLVMARNPYSRLYSAYIDKVFILNTLGLCKNIVSKLFKKGDRKQMCKYDITFEQFLEYYFEKGGTMMESHYGPLLSTRMGRRICNLNNILIVKQETFTKDIDYALKSVHVNDREYNIIYDEMHSKHTTTTISSITKTVYKKFALNIQSRSCLTLKDIARKLWISFQIQGYIQETSRFPIEDFTRHTDYSSPEYFIRLVMKEVARHPLEHKEKIKQRNKALVNAYSKVNKRYIHEIQERYAMDFDMFQYNIDLKNSIT